MKSKSWIMATVLAFGVMTAVTSIKSPVMASDKPAGRACVDMGDLETRRIFNNNQFYVRDRLGRAAIISFGAPCAHMDELDQLGLIIYGVSSMCSSRDVHFTHRRHGGIAVQCIAEDFQPLTADEAKAFEANETVPSRRRSH